MAHTLSRALRRKADGGVPLPTVFHLWETAGIRPRRGQVMMICGAPSAGKSFLALVAAMRCKVPTLYISADSDEFTQITRAASSASGDTLQEVEEALEAGADEVYASAISEAEHIHFVFDPSPSLEDIALDIEAFVESWGEEPHLIVVDNLMNVQAEVGDEWAGMREIAKALHHYARQYGSGVWLLHHTSESSEYKVNECPPRRAIQGKVAQLPEVILTVAQDGQGHLLTAAVKNRNGPADPTGRTAVAFHVIPGRMQLLESAQMAEMYRAKDREWTS